MVKLFPVKLLVLALCFLLSQLSPPAAYAGKLTMKPQVFGRTTYNDNVQFKDISDTEFSITPKYMMEYAKDVWSVEAGGQIDALIYAQHSEFNRNNFKGWLKGHKNISETILVDADFNYIFDHTFETELEESGYATEQSIRKELDFSPTVTWQVTEKDSVQTQLTYTDIRFANDIYSDYWLLNALMLWVHQLKDEHTSLLVQADYTFLDFDQPNGDTKQHIYRAMGGIEYNATETFKIRSLVGVSCSDTKADTTTSGSSNSSDILLNWDISGTYTWDRWEFTLATDRSESPTVYGDSSLRNRVRFSGNYNFTKRLSASTELAYYTTKTDGLQEKERKKSYYIRPALNYKINEDAWLKLGMRHFAIEDLEIDNTRTQNIFFIELGISLPSTL